MAKKRRPPKPRKPRRDKKYNPQKQGDDDYQHAQGFMQGVTRGLRQVVGTDTVMETGGDVQEGTSPWVKLVWLILIGGAGAYLVYRYVLN